LPVAGRTSGTAAAVGSDEGNPVQLNAAAAAGSGSVLGSWAAGSAGGSPLRHSRQFAPMLQLDQQQANEQQQQQQGPQAQVPPPLQQQQQQPDLLQQLPSGGLDRQTAAASAIVEPPRSESSSEAAAAASPVRVQRRSRVSEHI
jgi:hypothetical protein